MSHAVRPHRLIVVAGTATDIGKTWASAHLIQGLVDRRVTVAARKPAQSFEPDEPFTDAHELAKATGEDPLVVCPEHRWYEMPMAPPMAAEVLDSEPLMLADLVEEVRSSWPGRAPDVGIVELAGGPRSPMALDGDCVDVTQHLAPDLVILVADAGLGTLNAVRQSVGDLAPLAPVVVLLNRFDETSDLHERNIDWLRGRDGLDVVSDIDGLTGVVLDILPTYCTGCGRPAGECLGDCASELDPQRFCRRCGRRLAVTITPNGHTARCRSHGEVG